MGAARRALALAGPIVGVCLLSQPLSLTVSALAAPVASHDVLVSNIYGGGDVNEYTPSGVLVQTLSTLHAQATGITFDSSTNLFVTNFGDQAVTEFDANGDRIGDFGSGYNADPESVAAGHDGKIYVGQADGNHSILEFDPSGASVAAYTPAVQNRGTDWIDPATDPCVIRYTSEGLDVLQYNICTNSQLPKFNAAPLPENAYEVRQRPNGELLVADTNEVVRLAPTGALIQTYAVGNPSSLYSLTLDPDGSSFWTADQASGGSVSKLDINSGRSWRRGTLRPAFTRPGSRYEVSQRLVVQRCPRFAPRLSCYLWPSLRRSGCG